MLNLKTSITRNTLKEARAQIDKDMEKLRERVRNGPTEASIRRMEEALVKLQARTATDTLILKEKEDSLAAMEEDLTERAQLLKAKEQVLKSRSAAMPETSLSPAQQDERDALENLRIELDKRDDSQKELQAFLNEREAYIEKCENNLCSKAYKLTEREAWVEQAEIKAGKQLKPEA